MCDFMITLARSLLLFFVACKDFDMYLDNLVIPQSNLGD